jgi:hypothetical protein
MAKKSLEDQIKEMEKKNREAAIIARPAPVSFDSWFHQRSDKIDKCHRKEIIMADFKARGVSEEATIEEFDKALALYGVKL